MNIMYQGQFKDFQNNTIIFNILTSDTVTTEELFIQDLKINYPDNTLLSNSVCNGGGGDLTILSTDVMRFTSKLYTNDFLKYPVQILKNNVVDFIGYLDSEQFNDSINDMPVTFTFNDGINVLDRLYYIKSDGSNYTGTDSIITVIKRCLDSLNIDFNDINISVSTTSPLVSSNQTILHISHINNANFYDEKSKPSTLREVIDILLIPFACKLFFHKQSVYIIDINTLAADNITFEKYNYQDLSFIDSASINNNTEIINLYKDIDGIGMQQALNQVNVKFNKYCYDNPTSFVCNAENISVNDDTQTFTGVDSTGNETTYLETTYLHHDQITQTNHPVYFVYQEQTTTDKENQYFFKYNGFNALSYEDVLESSSNFKINTGLILNSSKSWINVSFNYMIQDRNRFGEKYENNTHYNVFNKIEIGDYTYHWLIGWIDNERLTQLGYSPYIQTNNNGMKYYKNWLGWFNMGNVVPQKYNEWVNVSMTIPLNNDLNLHNGYNYQPGTPSYILLEEIRRNVIEGGELNIHFGGDVLPTGMSYLIKNVDIKLVNMTEKGEYVDVSNGDIEITGSLNPLWSNDLDVDIKAGTDQQGNSRGAITLQVSGLYDDSDYAVNTRVVNARTFNRSGNTKSIEILLLNTYLSNYETGRYQFNTLVDGYYTPFSTFQNDFFQRNEINVRLFPSKMTVDYIQAKTELTLTEFIGDKMTF